jgi:hypothetical protein
MMIYPAMTTMPRVLIKTRGWLRNSFRREAFILLALSALVIISWLPRLSGPIDLRWDGGAYYILGTSLAEGKGYKLLNEPGDIDAIQYPPLLPAIIAAHQWILGTSDPITVGRWLRFSLFLISILYILASYSMVRPYLPAFYAFLATTISLFNLHTYHLSNLCFPEILFGLTTALFIISNRNSHGKFYPVLTPIFAMASYALRTIGIAILLAWIAESVFNREFKRVTYRLILALIPIICWQLYASSVESSQSYHSPVYEYQRADYLFYNVSYAKNISLEDPFTPELGYISLKTLTNRLLTNLAALPTSLGEAVGVKKALWELSWEWLNKNILFIPLTSWPIYFPLTVLGSLIFGGVSLQLARRQWIIPFYILIYLGGLCLTPWPEQFPRYLVPLGPFIALSLFIMLLTVKGWSCKVLTAKHAFVCSVFTVLIIPLIIIQEFVVSFLAYTTRYQKVIYNDQNGHKVMYHLFFYTDAYRALDAGLDWLMSQAQPTAIVASSMPHWVYLRTGLKSVMPPFEANPIKAQYLLDSVPVAYLILDQGLAMDTKKYTVPVVQNFPERWKLVYSDSIMSDSIISKLGQELDGKFEIYQRLDPQIPSPNRNEKAFP